MKKLNLDLEDLILRVLGIAVLAIITLIFLLSDFLLFCAVLALIFVFWLLKIFRNIRMLSHVKKQFAERGVTDIRVKINPFGSRLNGNYGLYCKYKGEIHSVAVLIRKNPWTRCHFESSDKIEYYKSSRTTFRAGRVGPVARGDVYTRLVGTRRLKWCCESKGLPTKKLAVFNKMPINITSSEMSGIIDIGMNICEDTTVYDIRSFYKFFD